MAILAYFETFSWLKRTSQSNSGRGIAAMRKKEVNRSWSEFRMNGRRSTTVYHEMAATLRFGIFNLYKQFIQFSSG